MSFLISHERKFFTLFLLLFCSSLAFAQRGAVYPIATVSAASYEPNAAVAPGSIVSTFGTNLATTTAVATDTNPATPVIELPTILGGTTVQVNNIFCGLLYVSPNQVNFVMPEGLSDGNYPIAITAGNSALSLGNLNVSRVQPSIFSMNSDGQGVIAASVVRVKTDGSQQRESASQFDAATNRMIPKPIDLGPSGERVFLEIYLTGIRQAQDENNDGNLNEHVFVVLGGKSITPAFAGKQGFFAGIDQINVELPRSLIGKGKISLSIHGNVSAPLRSGPGFTSNAVELEIAPAKSATPPTISNLNVSTANIGDLVIINGSGFGSGLFDNVVTFGGIKGDVEFANSTQLAARIPFGAKTGKVKVVNTQGEATSPTDVQLRTSLSGIIESSITPDIFAPFPLQNITVRVTGTNLSATTNQAGRFILNDVPVGAVTLEIDPSTFALSTKFPSVTLKTTIESGRDNALPATIWLNATGLFSPVQFTEWNALTGVLTDTDGVTPVPNALIRLLGTDALTTQTTVTDNNGAYVFRNVASSTVVAEVIRANGTVLQTSGAINLAAAIGKLNGVGVLDLSLKNAPTNRKPIILAPETAALKVTETLNISVYIADPDVNDTLQVSTSGLQNASLIAGLNGFYTLRLNPTTQGVFTLEIKAVDSQGNQTTSTMTVKVAGSNAAPLLTVPASQTVNAGQSLFFSVSATDPDAGQTVQLSATGLPAGAGFNLIGNFFWTPSVNQIGTYTVTFTAKDSGTPQQSVTKSVTITVTVTPPPGAWTIISASLPNTVTTVAVEGSNVYVGVYGNGVYTTSDLGVTWQARNIGLTGVYVRSIAVSGNTLLASIDETGIFRSTDQGLSWAKTSLALPNIASRVTAAGSVFFAYNINGGDAFYSSDQGITWSALGVTKFVSDGKGVNFAQTADGKVYKISVSGNTVTRTLTSFFLGNMPQAVTVTTNKFFAANPQIDANSNATYASSDSGINWDSITTFPTRNYTALFGIGNKIFASTNQGAIASSDEGQTWSPMTLPSFEFMAANALYLFAKNGANLYVMPNVALVSVLPAKPENIKKIPIDFQITAMAFQGNNYFVGTLDRGVLRSKDGGLTWQELNNGITDKSIGSLINVGGTIYGATLYSLTEGPAPFVSYGGVYSLSPGSDNWELYFAYYRRNSGGSQYFLGEFQSKPVTYYKQQGYLGVLAYGASEAEYGLGMAKVSSFLDYNGELFMGLSEQQYGYDPVFGPLRASIIKINSSSGKIEKVNSPLKVVTDLASVGKTIFAIDGQIAQSTDNGTNWSYLGFSELADTPATGMIKVGNKLIISCSKGLLITSNPQQSWQLMPLNLNNQAITKMYTNGTDLFCITADGSLYQVGGI